MTSPSDEHAGVTTVRRLLWLYCILWLIEGALRKWVLPQLSAALLLVRDPVVLLIYYYASRARVFPSNGWMSAFWIISALLGIQSLFHLVASNMPPDVIAFGFRTFVLHMPLIWVVPAVIGRKEIVLMGKWVLCIAPFLAGLMVIQFDLPKDHWLNAASLRGGEQIGSGMGKIRPPGFFSFIQGPINFFTICPALIIGGFLHPKSFPRWLMMVGILSTLAAVAVSGSRGMFLNCVVVCLFGAIAAIRSGKSIGGLVFVVVCVVAGTAFLSKFEIMRTGQEIMQERWTNVGEEGEGMTGSRAMAERVGGIFGSAATWAVEAPLFGFGAGSSSNLGQERTRRFAPVETEWERVIYEMGPVTALIYLLFRGAFAIGLVVWGFKAMRSGNYFCLLLASASFLDMMLGNFRQVTSYGYAVVCAGLSLAAQRAFSGEEEVPIAEQVGDVMEEKPKARGRGRFAVGGTPMRP